jgi:hypothetical protein
MIVSGTILKTSLDRYRRARKNKENFSISVSDSAGAGATAAFASFTLVVAVIFFILELIVLFYAINMALACTKGGPERIVNIVLAITFTIPYVMLNILFNKCAKSSLRGDSWLPGSKS